MNVKLQKIAAQKRIKRNLAHAIETSGTSAGGLNWISISKDV